MMNGVIPVVLAGAFETVGSVGAVPAMPKLGAKPTVGTAAAELTPRLPISVDASGIPVRATPPGVMGDVGVDDEAMLLAPEPHIPDSPDVSNPEVVDIPDEVDIPEDIAIPAIPAVAAVAGIAVPIVVPPPSKVAVDPNMPADAVPAVEHVVPLPGIAMVPVESVGAGLIPGEASSVDPNGMPVGETGESPEIPSGEVAPMAGVGGAMPPTCAMATLQVKSAGMTAAANENRIGILSTALPQPAPMSISLATIPPGASISDIGQSLGNGARLRWCCAAV